MGWESKESSYLPGESPFFSCSVTEDSLGSYFILFYFLKDFNIKRVKDAIMCF